MSSSKKDLLLNISSRDRISGDTNDFLVNIVQGGFNGAKSVRLQSCTIPKSIYNINSSNNVFQINDGGVQTVTLTPGNYTIGQLMVELKTQLDAASANTYTCTYDNIAMRVTIASTGATSYLFSQGGPWRELGFDEADTASLVSVTGTNTPMLYWPLSVFILVDKFPLGGYNSNNGRYTFRVPMNVNSADILNYEPMHEQIIYFGGCGGSIGQIRVTLSYSDGSLIDLGNADWEMVLKISF